MKLRGTFVLLAMVATVSVAAADSSPVGTWVKKGDDKIGMTVTITMWGDAKVDITWNLKSLNAVMKVVAVLDGSDAPVLVNGKPSGETMAIKRVDSHHASTVIKMNGKPFGTSNSAFSADFTTMTVENDFTTATGANPAGKSTEVWIRK